jgi:hypothetical protein
MRDPEGQLLGSLLFDLAKAPCGVLTINLNCAIFSATSCVRMHFLESFFVAQPLKCRQFVLHKLLQTLPIYIAQTSAMNVLLLGGS